MGSFATFFPVILLFCLITPQTVHSKNILVFSAVGTHSIRISLQPYMEKLSDNHNVTFITVFEDFEKNPNKTGKVTTVVPRKWKQAMESWETKENSFYNIRKTFYGVAKEWYDRRDRGVQACKYLYSDPEFLEWIEKSPKYDLVIVEMLHNECAYGLVQLWNAKLIIYSTISVVPDFPDGHGFPDESSSISDLTFGFPAGEEMTFLQRFVNAFNSILFSLTKELLYFPQLEEITKKGFKMMGRGDQEVLKFSEVERNASLILLTTHFSLGYPRALPPHAIQIGGSLVTTKQKPLPKKMEKFLDSSVNGFIYISFGSVIEFFNFDEPTQEEFVKALYQFPDINFLWKASTKINMSLPENVLITRWAPQQTVLAHPNIKAFVSHVGTGGLVEAIASSVPIICFPIIAEADHNSEFIKARNAGIRLELIGLKQEHLENAISEILYNEKYRMGMSKLTKIFKDRPSPPLEDAIWWTEFVLRHDNVNEFLLHPSAHQPWWKKRQIDVWITATLILTVFTFALIFVAYKLLHFVLFSEPFTSKLEAKLKKS